MKKRGKIMTKVADTASKVVFKTKKASPEIMMVAGVIGIGAGIVMACKATRKIDDILDKAKEDIDIIHNIAENDANQEVYTEEDHDKDLMITYVQTGVKLVKLYAPAAIVTGISIYAMVKSNRILKKRNLALTAAYTALKKDFGGYRSRVVERFGETVDKELKYNIKAKQFEEKVIDEKTGKEKTVKKTVNIIDPDLPNEYARWFDDSCNGWEENSEYSMMYLRGLQKMLNDRLIARGHIFLNEVYDELGIPRTEAGQYVGWVYDPVNPLGDNHINFGIFEAHREINRDFVNGYENVILLDFNVDGDIMAQMKTRPQCFEHHRLGWKRNK